VIVEATIVGTESASPYAVGSQFDIVVNVAQVLIDQFPIADIVESKVNLQLGEYEAASREEAS